MKISLYLKGIPLRYAFFEAVSKVEANADLKAAIESVLGDEGSNVSWSADSKILSFDVTATTQSSYQISFEDAAGNVDLLSMTLDVI